MIITRSIIIYYNIISNYILNYFEFNENYKFTLNYYSFFSCDNNYNTFLTF